MFIFIPAVFFLPLDSNVSSITYVVFMTHQNYLISYKFFSSAKCASIVNLYTYICLWRIHSDIRFVHVSHKMKQNRRVWSTGCIVHDSGKCHAAMSVNRSLISENNCNLFHKILCHLLYMIKSYTFLPQPLSFVLYCT